MALVWYYIPKTGVQWECEADNDVHAIEVIKELEDIKRVPPTWKIWIEKNGTQVAATGHIGAIRPQVVTHLYMNGSTDYVQFKAYTQSSTTRGQSAANSFFEALLVKQAQ